MDALESLTRGKDRYKRSFYQSSKDNNELSISKILVLYGHNRLLHD